MVKFLSRLLIVTLMAGPVMTSAAFLDDYEGDIDTEAQTECLVLTKDLRLRSRDAKTDGEVSLLQDFLNTRGFLKAEPTGFFSISTFVAVKAFQKEQKLRPTGFVSVLTRRAIEKVSCDGTTTQTVSVTLKSNVRSYEEGDTIIFTAKVTEQDGTPLTPQEGATVTLHQVSEDGNINDRDTMSYDRRSGSYVLRADDHTTADDAGRWTAFVTVTKNGVSVGTSDKITYRVVADTVNVPCTETDNGMDIYTKGTTKGAPKYGAWYSEEDSCIDGTNRLKEHLCSDSLHAYTVVECPNGCSNGACLRASEPPMRVIYPNGGEVWTEGRDYFMRWTPTAKQVPSIQKIDQYVIDENGNNVIIPSFGRTNTGEDGWTPRGLNGKFKLKICQSGTTNCDTSDDYFTIVSAQQNLAPVIHDIRTPKSLKVGESGTWTMVASDPENRPLKHYVIWGDEYVPSGGIKHLGNIPYSQVATFTHTYMKAGTYTPKFYVQDDIGQLQMISATIVVKDDTPNYDACRLDKLNGANITKQAILDRDSCLRNLCDIYGPANLGQTSSKCMFMGQEIKRYTQQPYAVSVLSPNGGEIWDIGSTYTISYEIRMLSFKFMPGARIYLEKEYEPGSYKKGINSSMLIGTTSDTGQYTYTVPDIIRKWPGLGSNYRIKVCTDSHGQICDSSDRTFTIRTAPAVTNLPPVIDGLTAPTTLTAGQPGQWTVKASDPENKPLQYAVVWGDEPIAKEMNGIIMAAPGSSFVQTATFTHTYAKAGTYTPKFFVKDDAGQVQSTSASVMVGSPISPAVYKADLWMGKNTYSLGEDVQLFAKVTRASGGIFTPSEGAEVTAMLTDQNGRSFGKRLLRYNSTSGNYEWQEGLGIGKWVYVITVTKHDVTVLKDRMTGFSVVAPVNNLPPVIHSIKTPLYVSAGEVTLWTVNARDPENKPLTYAAFWGDEASPISGADKPPDSAFGKYSLLNHRYASPGTYMARFFVKDDVGQVHSTDVQVQVQPSSPYGVDACRLDELNGRNVTRGAINDRDICLSKFCDIYGPGNLHLFPSKCVFMGQEIKRYEKVSPTAPSAQMPDMQPTHTVGQPVKINMKGITIEDVVGMQDQVNVQARL